MRKTQKMISLILAIITILTTILPVICNLSEVIAATYEVQYYGKVKYGYSTVGDFTVNGARAFCIDHSKPTPPTGALATMEIYENQNIAKCLYYGWGGDKQWSGFVNANHGIVATSLALEYYNNGTFYNDARGFIEYLESVSMPDITLNFSNRNLTAYIDGNMQRTQSTTVTGDSNYFLTIRLQNNVTLVNETRGTENTGTVNVYGGDTFYLKAPLSMSGSWTSDNINNCKYIFQPIIYRTEVQSYQDLAGKVTVREDPTTTTNLSANWLSTANLAINKVDEDNKSVGVSNTTFDIYNSNDDYITTVTTNNNGIARVENISLGEYKIVEKTANDYYIANNTPTLVTLGSGENNVTITNKKKSGFIEINKYDEEDKSIKLSNVKFGIYDTNNKLIETLTTNADGYVKSSTLDLNKQYIVKELSTNDNYVLSDSTWNVNLTKNGIVDGYTETLNISNARKTGNLIITKVDKDDNKVGISGVEFNLYSEEYGKVIGTYTTNSEGKITINNLKTGIYKLIETKTNKWYNLTDDTEIVIKANETTNATIQNELKKGQIKIIKVDKDNNEVKIPGVKFEVLDKNNKVLETITTDKNGEATTKKYAVRDYSELKLHEVETNQWYVLNNKTQTVTLEENQIKTITFENEKKKAQIKVIKVDLDNNEVKLQGVTFEVLDENGNVVDTITTNKDGEATTKKLTIDKKYTVREKETLKEYVLSKETKTVELKENEIKTITFENEKRKGQVKVIKVDLDNNEVKLQGVTFEVLNKNGNVVDTITTDKNGEATTKRLPIDQQYKIREKQTLNEYVLSTETQTITLEENKIKTITFENEKKKAQIKVIKVDLDNNAIRLEGVTFEVINDNGKIVDTITTNVNGEATTKRLPIDSKYTIREKETLKEYVLSTENQVVELKENEIKSVTFTNEKRKGQIRVIKVDLDNNEVKLQGVTFEVLDENNNVVDTITTDKNGEATTKRLAIDQKYTIREKQTLKEYVLSNETQTVELKENEIKSITFKNEKKKAQIKVIKVDLDNKAIRLEGVTFDVLDEKGNVVDTIKTNKNGEAITKKLPIDQRYTVREKETLKDYVLTKETQTIELKENEIKSITFTNEKKKAQIKVIKIDLDNNSVKLEGVKFEVLDENKNIVDTLTTNKNGEAITKRLPIDQKYTIRETKTLKEYVLTTEIQTVELKEDEIKSITFKNEKIKGYVEITKVDSASNELLKDVVFGIYNKDDELVEKIITDSLGKTKSNLLPYGNYYLKELETGSPYYLLNEEIFEFEIRKNHEIIPITISNDGVEIEVDVDKKGTIEIKPGDEVNYEFSDIANNSNTYLENFTWYDYIPTDYIRLETMTTGTWNQELNYKVYYKTNKLEDYILFKENLSTLENYYLDFREIQLDEDEYIIETCFDFGKVDIGFREDVGPTMNCKSLDTLTKDDTFTNHTKTVGTYFGITAESNSKWTTIVHVPKKKTENVLPRTGK